MEVYCTKGQQSFSGRMGTLGLFLFAFFSFLGIAGAHLGLGLILVAFIINIDDVWSQIKYDRVFWLSIASLFYLIVHTSWAMVSLPALFDEHIKEASDWGKLILFICVAWQLKQDRNMIGVLLLVIAAGFILGLILSIDWGNIETLFSGERQRFHMMSNRIGIYSSVGIVGLVVLVNKFIGASGQYHITLLRKALWLVALVILVQANIASQSRGAWLSLIIVLPIVLVLGVRAHFLNKKSSITSNTHMLVISLICVIGLIFLNIDSFKKRLGSQQVAVDAIVSQKYDKLPPVSTTWRFNVYLYGIEKWLERPLFGWGAGSTEYLIKVSGNEGLNLPGSSGGLEWMDHFHSTYLEILIRFGIVGLLFIFCVIWYVILELWKTYKANRADPDYVLFIMSGFGVIAIWSLFDFRITHYDGRFLWYIVGGLAFSYGLKLQMKTE